MYHNGQLSQKTFSAEKLNNKYVTLLSKKVRKSHWLAGVSPLALAACGGGGSEGGSGGGSSIAVVTGTSGADTFANSAADQRFEGGLGNDVYEFNYGGSDTIVDTGGIDELILLLRDEAGNDPRKSFERVGDDLVITQTDGSAVTIDNQFQGSNGINYINYYLNDSSMGKEKVGSLAVASVSETESNLLVGTSENQTFVYEGAATLSIWTNAGNDTITTGSGDDWIRTGGGDDIIDAGQGDDHVFAGDGDDIVYMSPGADIEDGGDGVDTLILGYWAGDYSGTINLETGANFAAGGADNADHKVYNFENIIIQHSGDMTIYGTSGDNIITTGSGSDIVYAGAGNDTLTGNGGADTFVFIEGETGTDAITDFDLAEGDKLDLSSYGITSETTAAALMSDATGGINITIDGNIVTTISGVTVASFTTADGWLTNGETITPNTPTSHYSFETNGGSYVLVAEAKTYSDSAAYARSELNGTLASFETKSEADGFYAMLQSTVASNNLSLTAAPDGGDAEYIWLGATDSVTEGSWIWDSGESLSYNDFWGSGALGSEPDNFQNQDAMAIGMENWPAGSGTGAGYGNEGFWNDVDVSNTLYFVVEVA